MTSNIWNLNLAKWSVLGQVSRSKSWDEGSCARCLFRRCCTQKTIWKWRKQGRPGQKPSREGLQQLPAHLQGLSEWKWCLSYPDLKWGGLLLAFILPCPSVMGLGPPYTMEVSRHFELPAQVGEDSQSPTAGSQERVKQTLQTDTQKPERSLIRILYRGLVYNLCFK